MLRQLVINAGMLVAFISLCYQIFGYIGFNKSLRLKYKLVAGMLFGLLGVVLLEFSIILPNEVLMDFRSLPIIIATIYGGFVPGAFASLIIAVDRALRFGISTSSMVGAIIILAIFLTTVYISTRKVSIIKKWIFCVFGAEILASIAYCLLIDELKQRIIIISIYFLANISISVVIYFYVSYLEQYTDLFRRYRNESNIDFLTGLNNVRQFDSIFNDVISKVEYTQEKVSLLFIDIDFFKKVNDTYGHKEGDIVLKKLGEILLKNRRSVDIVSRNGGEEFSVILINCEPSIAYEIAEKIRSTVEGETFELSDNINIKVTVSIGIASFPDDVMDINTLCEKADEALYMAKRSGRNKVAVSCFK